MKIFSRAKSPKVIGLDIGRSEIKAVQLGRNKNGQVELVAYGNQPLPTSANIDPITYPKHYLPALSSLLAGPRFGSFDATHFAISLPARHTFLSSAKSTKEFSDLASKHLHTEPEALHIQTYETQGGLPRGLAASRASIDPHLAALNAYLPIVASEHELAAAARAFDIAGSSTILVDIGSRHTVMGNYNTQLDATVVINMGVDTLVGAFAEKNSLQLSQAAEILYSFGLQTSSMQVKIRESIKPLVAQLAEQIKLFIGQQARPPERIILFGGGACIPAFASYIARFLEHPVKIGNPWATTDIYPLKPMPRKLAPQFSVAVGLALLGLR